MTGTNKRGIRRYKRHRKRVRILRLLALFVIFTAAVLMISKASAYYGKAKISITPNDAQILQGEEMPVLDARIALEGSPKIILDDETDYSVDDLTKDLLAGNGYTIVTNGDAAAEGNYISKAVLDEEIVEKLETEWLGTVEIQLINGSFIVKNALGEWDGIKFKTYEGEYVTDKFIVSMGNTFYIDKNGDKVSGWQLIKDSTYYFNDLGVMQKSCWQNNEADRYYLGEDGKALTGWQEIDGETYYFQLDSKMAVGEHYIGIARCTFSEDGRLIDKKISDIDPDKPMVALTFDDGPGKRTMELLNALEKNDAHATFFMQGKNVPRYKDEVKKMKEIGCEIGNHSYDHPDLSKASAEGIKNQVGKTNAELEKILGTQATVMRPPYGAISKTLRENVGMPMILWNIDTLDWKTRDAKKTIKAVMEHVKDGDVILMHDIHSETVDAALKLIPMLQEEGFQLVTVSELAGSKNVELKKGEKYTDF